LRVISSIIVAIIVLEVFLGLVILKFVLLLLTLIIG
jgi:hypothetical protein